MPNNYFAILVQGLKNAYKNVPVLDRRRLSGETRQHFPLLGNNGAGKTTIVKIMAFVPAASMPGPVPAFAEISR